jgi:tRNA 2-thiouridine synthesizing protein A
MVTPPDPTPAREWDAGHKGCGEILMELRIVMLALEPRAVLKLTAHDGGAPEDLPAWCRMTGHKLVKAEHPDYWIQRRDN